MIDNIQSLKSYTFKSFCQLYPRINHRAILIDRHILVFGGVNTHNDFVTSILRINCESYEVLQLSTVNSLPIQGHSLGYFNDKVYIWGGRKPSQQNYLIKCPKQFGSQPKPRHMHASVMYAEKYMIIYGGMSDIAIFNDWYALNLQTKTWIQLNPNIILPLNLKPKMTWLGTRGILLISEIHNEKTQQVQDACLLYQFKIRKNGQQLKLIIEPIEINFQQKPFKPRASPAICKFKADSLYLAIIGGEKFKSFAMDSSHHHHFPGDVWLLNLETFVLRKAEHVKLISRLSMEAIFYKDRILMIGGVMNMQEFSQHLEVLDLQMKDVGIDRKVCMVCRSTFGLEDYGKPKISIKCQYESHPNFYLSATLVKKLAEVIRNPIKAFGLLIDNSIMMNANLIQIQLKTVKIDKRFAVESSQKDQLYVEYTENSYGFSKQEVIDCMYTFGYKTETFSHDVKFQEELAVRKQYGYNLKLAVLRLGDSCLYITNSTDNEKFVGYFSVKSENCPQFQDRFNCFYYFIDTNGNVSSLANRQIIQKNIQSYLNLQKVEKKGKSKTKIFIFDFNKKSEFCSIQSKSNLQYEDRDQGPIINNLNKYLSYLYLKPYVGRTIKLSFDPVQCQSLAELCKIKQKQGNLNRILLNSNVTENFSSIELYHVLAYVQQLGNKVYVYSTNRLLSFFQFQDEEVCGFIDLKGNIQVNIGKSGIENAIEQKQIYRYLKKLIELNPYKSKNIKQSQEDSEIVDKVSKKVKKSQK